jgi:hypothetical protein
MKSRVRLLLLALVLLMLTSPVFGQRSVSLDHVDGLSSPGVISAGRPVVFHLRIGNPDVAVIAGSTNGFRLYSIDGATWSLPVADTVALNWSQIYDGGMALSLQVTGANADTVGFGGYALASVGLETDFDAVVFTITTSFDLDQAGRTVCLDSCFYAPAGYWMWTFPEGGWTYPTWDGPHCFTIGGCCDGLADDPNGDGAGPDIADLIHLVNFMFQDGPAAPCPEEVDINGDSAGPDIADLIHLVNFMFQGGDAPAACH